MFLDISYAKYVSWRKSLLKENVLKGLYKILLCILIFGQVVPGQESNLYFSGIARHRMAFEPTALPIESGRFIIESREYLIWSVGYGVAERLSVELVYFPANIFNNPSSVSLITKIMVYSGDKLYTSIGVLSGIALEKNKNLPIAAPFSAITVQNGWTRVNLVISVGRSADDEDLTVMLFGGFEKFISESWSGIASTAVVLEEEGVNRVTPYLGVRYNSTRASLDVGVIPYFGDEIPCPIPYFTVTYGF